MTDTPAPATGMTKGPAPMTDTARGAAANPLRRLFVRLGVLPFFLAGALIVFTILSDRFLTVDNLVNVARQSVYLMLVSLGQMLVLITGGFDLSVGAAVAYGAPAATGVPDF